MAKFQVVKYLEHADKPYFPGDVLELDDLAIAAFHDDALKPLKEPAKPPDKEDKKAIKAVPAPAPETKS